MACSTYGAEQFNRDISTWDISFVADIDFMFFGASSFNQNLCSWKSDFPYGSSSTNIFAGTDCTFTGNPVQANLGPFCANDCKPSFAPSNSLQPSLTPSKSVEPSASAQPSSEPTFVPSSKPSFVPSISRQPSSMPSLTPSLNPSQSSLPSVTAKTTKAPKADTDESSSLFE